MRLLLVLRCNKIAEAEAAVSVNKKVVSDAGACANAAIRALGPPKPLAHSLVTGAAVLVGILVGGVDTFGPDL
jgi:hypothetical protein